MLTENPLFENKYPGIIKKQGVSGTSFAIETANLSKTYKSGKKTLNALKDLNLNVEEGQVFGFIGPNGAGKTTTIKILIGLIKATKGEARIFNEKAGSVASKSKIGYLSEMAYYYNFMEAENLLHFYGSLRSIPREEREKSIRDNLEIVGLYERRKTRLKEYSKGMLQRFGIALAFIGSPPLLILDEPTSGLDPIGQKEVKDIILHLKERGITIFLSSHQLTEVEKICDQIGIIHQGTMIQCGPLTDFLQQEKGIYTLRFTTENQELIEIMTKTGAKIIKKEDQTITSTVEEKNLLESIQIILQKGGKLMEAFPGPGNLEEIFFETIMKGGKQV